MWSCLLWLALLAELVQNSTIMRSKKEKLLMAWRRAGTAVITVEYGDEDIELQGLFLVCTTTASEATNQRHGAFHQEVHPSQP